MVTCEIYMGQRCQKKEYVCEVCQGKYTNKRQMMRCKHRPLTAEETIEEKSMEDDSINEGHFLSDLNCQEEMVHKADPFVGHELTEPVTDAFLGL